MEFDKLFHYKRSVDFGASYLLSRAFFKVTGGDKAGS